MIEIVYGCIVALAGALAYWSGSAVLRRIMAVLFFGWLIYTNTDSEQGLPPPMFNLYLDVALLAVISGLYVAWKNAPRLVCCHCVAGILGIMIMLHIAKKPLDMGDHAYYLTCNLLFLAQLMAVSIFSILEIRSTHKKKTKPVNEDDPKWPIISKESQSLKVVQMPLKRT